MTLMLKDGAEVVERYKQHHRSVWPEVVVRLREIGIVEMKIFLLDRRLFMYMEAIDGFDPGREFPKLSEDARYREWDELMAGLQEPAPEAKAGEWWAAMEEVFDLSRQ
jgi:L-rhamnose mutarotase